MIDEFIEFLLVPLLPIIMQIILIAINMHVIKDLEEDFKVPQLLLWIIFTISIFPLFWGIVLQVTSVFTLVLISLFLMFTQLLINIQYLLKNKKRMK